LTKEFQKGKNRLREIGLWSNEKVWEDEMNLIASIGKSAENKTVGRIGGNLPCLFLDRESEIEGYRFYMMFQNPDNHEEYFSIFVPEDYGVMIDNNTYPNCSVKVFSHRFSKESDNTNYTLKGIKKSFLTGYSEVDDNTFDFFTKSRFPQLIQEESYDTEKLEKEGYEFFVQIDEDYYTEDLINENYIFGYGALYLYRHSENGTVIAGFWQYS